MRALLVAALAIAAAPLSGCARVKPYEREIIALPEMALHPDPDEETLDLHMLEAREGSSGGFGSAGGGCGCN